MNSRQLAAALSLLILTLPGQLVLAQDNNFFGAERFPTIFNSGGADIDSADLNGDGHTDVVVIENLVGGYSVHLGDGTGSFVFDNSDSNVTGSQSGALADINDDGITDIIVRESLFENLFSLYLGNGDGTFTFDSAPGLGLVNAEDFVVADVSNDGNPDIIATTFDNNGNGRLNILLGNAPGTGSGFWSAPTTVSIGSAASNEADLGDVNGDGALDIVVQSSFPDNSIRVFLNDGSGNFTAAPQGSISANSNGPQGAVIADFDNDGNADIGFAASTGFPDSMGIIGILEGNETVVFKTRYSQP